MLVQRGDIAGALQAVPEQCQQVLKVTFALHAC